jgi:YD repeat-containing protein
MILKFAVTLVVPLVLSSPAHAIVDMKNANFSDTWLDMTFAGLGSNLKIERTYNSRSVFNGIFGYGWCTEFETTIEKLPEGRLRLTECGAGQEILFSPAKFTEKELGKTIDAIIAHYKKINPGASEKTVETLRQQVTDFADLRADWAKNAGIAAPDAKKGVYTADTMNVETITFDGSIYRRDLSDGTSQRFDANGRLTHIYDKNSNYLKMTYTGDKMTEVVDHTGKKLTFSYYPSTRRVKDVVGPNGLRSDYKYKSEDLIEVKNLWRNTYAYQYDDTHNLTKITFPDATFKAIVYNQKSDWVTSFTDRVANGRSCTESYKYEMDKDSPKDHFWSTATKKCGPELVNEARFEFWHKAAANGSKYLSRVLTKSTNDSLDVTYHPEFGRPTIIKKNGTTTAFDYFPSGLVREKSTANVKMAYSYENSFNKVSKVLAEFFDGKGKVVRKRETTFSYDPKANLVAAQNSDGQSIKLTYDGRGRIATIIDHAKKEVAIKYDEKTGKPAEITRSKLGTIKVSYKPNGEISEVKSDDGPTVAVQIASTFNNLLDIIAPATSELNL